MNLTRSKFSKLLRIGLFVLVAVIVVGYATFRSLPYVRGPVINIFQPVNGSTISSTTVEIVGRAERVNAISINGNPISIDESGNFKETLVVFKGMNFITIVAQDQFKRVEKTVLTIRGAI